MAEACKNALESHQIAILVSKNIDSTKVLLSSLAPYEGYHAKATSQLARFKLWAGSLGADRKSGHRSLDYRLRDASSIRKHVINDSEVPVGEARGLPDHELIEYLVDDDESNQSSLDMALADISHVVDCLLRLSVTIKNPAPHDQIMSRAGSETMAYYEQYDIRHVREKFTRIENGLATRLGRAITNRRHFLKYREDHCARLSDGIGDDDGLAGNGDQTTEGSPVPRHLKDTLDGSPIGLDVRSLVSGTSYASSLGNLDELTVPPIPKEYRAGPFLCPFCYLMVEVDSENDWKKHVIRDLQPYICLAPFCLAQHHKFSRRSDWSHHMEQVHWRLWRCFCRHHEAFHDAEEFQCHLRKAHLNDLTLQQQETFEQMCSQVDLSKAVGPCPLCVEVHISSATQYYTHIGHHLEQLALFALPQIANEDDKSGSQNDGVERRISA
ncbi:hypothetical protein F5B21DRAFT_524327 [Xylaria acuta]|nr:hypothetical protein F5B21DRAFT_524327 [Xylaria acuta]